MNGDTYNADAEWWVRCADAALGERGTLLSTVNSLEHGGKGSALADTNPFHIRMLMRIGDVERARKCDAIWRRLDTKSQHEFRAYYGLQPKGGDGGKVVDERVGFLLALNYHFGNLGGLVVAIESRSGKSREELAAALKSPNSTDSQRVIGVVRDRASRRCRAIHRAWVDAARAIRREEKPDDARDGITRAREEYAKLEAKGA